MIPFRAEHRPPGRVIAVWVLAALCVAALVRLALMADARAASVVENLAVIPSQLLATPFSPGQLFTLLSSAFLHAGWLHLVGNVLYLSVFGPAVEARLGWKLFAGLYLICGAAGALTHAVSDPTSTVPLVGASGAIAGVLGAHMVLEPRSRIRTIVPVVIFIEIAILPAAFVIAFWFALQLGSALAPVAAGEASAVAWFAHLGGFATGMLIALAVVFSRTAGLGPHTPHGRRGPARSRRTA